MRKFSAVGIGVALLVAGLLAGCGGSGGSGGAAVAPVATTTISGVASKGLVSGATVTVYSVSNGTKDKVLGSNLTDALGSYSIDIGSYTGPVLLEVTGGSYKDEASGIRTSLADTLRAAVPNASGVVSACVSALTEAAVHNTLAAAGGLTAANIQAEIDNLKGQVGFDPIATMPSDATDAASAAASKDAKAYAAYLGSISQYMQNNPDKTPASAAIDYAAAFKSGGLAANAAIKKAVDDFGANANNKTGLAGMAELENLYASTSGGTSAGGDGIPLQTETERTRPTIVFDYSLDTNGFFTPARRALMESAAAVFTSRIAATTWARVDTTTAGGHYDLAFINPSTLEIQWVSDVVIPKNQITIYLGATDFTKSSIPMMKGSTGDGATQLLSIRSVSGGIASVLTNSSQLRPVNASISFDLQGIQGFGANIDRQWHFDSDGNLATDDRNPADPQYNGYTDFWDTAVHEIGHVLGIFHLGAYSSFLESDPNVNLAYTRLVQADGSGYVFTGENAKKLYYGHVGQNIPLDTSTRSHFADGVRSETADGYLSLSYERNVPFRRTFSELEFQALHDLGYTVSAKP
jgi:hypothetical protein